MPVAKLIENICTGLREGRFTSEAAVSQGILLPILHELHWPIFDTAIVIPEFSVEGRRVDFALCHPEKKPAVFVEVKKTGSSDGADRQLFEYAFHLGVPMAILMDGQEWSFYLPGEQGRYDERRVYKLDLLERDVAEIEKRLERYLGYQNICSGAALRFARSDYQDVARGRTIEAHLPKAWNALIEEQDSLLLEMLAEKVEDLCGYKPDLDACAHFLGSQINSGAFIPQKFTQPSAQSPKTPSIRQKTSTFTFMFNSETHTARSAREVMTKVFQLIAKEDRSFLERFASRKHGKKRQYIARDKYALYPGRPDLVEQHSIEILPGWWLGTNYSRQNIQVIIDMALEVAGPEIKKAFRVNVL